MGFACIQFWTADTSEVANAFTYGGDTVMKYPLTVYPTEVVKALTFVLPLAFVNWYPALYVLGRDDPFGCRAGSSTRHRSPRWCLTAAGLAWRTGVRHYRSTG